MQVTSGHNLLLELRAYSHSSCWLAILLFWPSQLLFIIHVATLFAFVDCFMLRQLLNGALDS